MTLTFIQGYKCVSNLITFYLGQYLSYYIQTWHDDGLMDAIYARVDDLGDLDARSQWVGKRTKVQILLAIKPAIIKLATTVCHFFT